MTRLAEARTTMLSLDVVFELGHRHIETVVDQGRVLLVADVLPLGKITAPVGPEWRILTTSSLLAVMPSRSASASSTCCCTSCWPTCWVKKFRIMGLSAYCGFRCWICLARDLLTAAARTTSPVENEAAVPVRIDDSVGIGSRIRRPGRQAGNQVNDHRHRGGGNDDDKQGLGQAIVSLQKTNHGWVGAFYSLRAGFYPLNTGPSRLADHNPRWTRLQIL